MTVNYYAQRRPEELADFVWTIDRKDRTVTQMEQLWSTLMLPMGVEVNPWSETAS